MKTTRLDDYMDQLLEEFAPMTRQEISKAVRFIWQGVIQKSLEGEIVRIQRPKGKKPFVSKIGFITKPSNIKEIRENSRAYNKNRKELYKLIRRHK